MKSLKVLLIVATIVAILSGLAISGVMYSAAHFLAPQTADKIEVALWNRFVAPKVPPTYYVLDVVEERCYEVSFVVSSDTEIPSMTARHRVENLPPSFCDDMKEAGKLVLSPDHAPSATLANLHQ